MRLYRLVNRSILCIYLCLSHCTWPSDKSRKLEVIIKKYISLITYSDGDHLEFIVKI